MLTVGVTGRHSEMNGELMARRVRSVRAGQGTAAERFECSQCGLAWTRPRQRGRVPQYCSDACKQAHWRSRLGSEEYNRRRREARAGNPRAAQVRKFRAVADGITGLSPLAPGRAMALLRELAGADTGDSSSPSRLYRSAATAWHPDLPDGDEKVFQLLQQAYTVARQHAP
ncbi:hypothetical protein RGQ21_00380 [Kitasatospora aureofaciens]|nr:hypothetical protein RGQ21_00380 [Kitasatospora aureofaciens]